MIFRCAHNQEVGSMPVLAVRSISGDLQCIPLQSTVISGEITGHIFAGDVIHVFRYDADRKCNYTEATYRFLLPGDAVVTGVEVCFGDTEVVTKLKPRQTAEEEYQASKKSGSYAVVLTRDDDVFTLCLFGVKPNEDVRIRTFFVKMSETEDDGYTLSLPLTFDTNFIKQFSKLGDMIAADYSFKIDISGFDIEDIVCSEYNPAFIFEDNEVVISINKVGIPAKDFVLWYKIETDKNKERLNIYTYDDGGRRYFLALADVGKREEALTNQEIVLLVEHSKLTKGKIWGNINKAVKELIEYLSPQSLFNLCIFGDETRWFSCNQTQIIGTQKEKIIKFLQQSIAGDKAEINPALEQALLQERMRDTVGRTIIIITATGSADSGRFLNWADREGRKIDNCSVNVVSLGGRNMDTLKQIALWSGGQALFVALNAEDKLLKALKSISDAVSSKGRIIINSNCTIANLPFRRNEDECSTTINLGNVSPKRLKWISGIVPALDDIEICLNLPNSNIIAAKIEKQMGHPALKHLFGAIRLQELEFFYQSPQYVGILEHRLRMLGYRNMSVRLKKNLHVKNRMIYIGKELQSLLMNESLRYGIAGSQTAFAAVFKLADKIVDGGYVTASELSAAWRNFPVNTASNETPSKNNDLYNDMCVDSIDWSVRTYNCLRRAGIESIGELLGKTEEELMMIRNLGRKSMDEIKTKLSAFGYRLADHGDDYETSKTRMCDTEEIGIPVDKEYFGKQEQMADDFLQKINNHTYQKNKSLCKTLREVHDTLLYANRPSPIDGRAVLNIYKATFRQKLKVVCAIIDEEFIFDGDEIRIYHGETVIGTIFLNDGLKIATDTWLESGDILRLELLTKRIRKWKRLEIRAGFIS